MRKLLILLFALSSLPAVHAQTDIRTNRPVKYAPNEIKINSTSYNFSNVKMCADVVPAVKYPLPARYPVNAATYYRINPDGTINSAYQRQPLAAYSEMMWMPGETIKYTVIDLNGNSYTMIDTVKKYVKFWEFFANIKLVYTTNASEATIRIGMEPGKSYSYIGRDALQIASNVKTMNLGWLGSDANNNRNVILHEFGHALGFIHEHMSPVAAIAWDKEKVYAYYAGAPNYWTKEMVDRNVFMKYSSTQTNYSAYDPLSVMHYAIDPSLTTDGKGTPFNSNLSQTDKQFATVFYPFPPPPPVATGTLKTGDDCDEIDFKIEYDVNSYDIVEFILQPGRNQHGNVIDFWKQITIPQIGYPARKIEIEGGRSSSYRVGPQYIDASKAIGFWKAKFLGIKTELNYKWNILQAVKGGCRVTLTWRKDSCL